MTPEEGSSDKDITLLNLRRENNLLRASIERQKNTIINREGLIRGQNIRLKKIRNSLDYLIQYPYATDNSIQSKKHDRDRKGKKALD